jgi:hypothetical protein
VLTVRDLFNIVDPNPHSELTILSIFVWFSYTSERKPPELRGGELYKYQ